MEKSEKQQQKVTLYTLNEISSLMAYEKPSTDAYVIDGPAFVHKYNPTLSNTYGSIASKNLHKKSRILHEVLIGWILYSTCTGHHRLKERHENPEGVESGYLSDQRHL